MVATFQILCLRNVEAQSLDHEEGTQVLLIHSVLHYPHRLDAGVRIILTV